MNIISGFRQLNPAQLLLVHSQELPERLAI
jgi:hypothetical protein